MKFKKRISPEARDMTQMFFPFVVICGAILFAAPPNKDAPKTTATRIECCGKLRYNNVGISGASTGTTVNTDGVIWELVLPNDKCKKFAHDHHKKQVKATGTLKKVSEKSLVIEVTDLVEFDSDPGTTIELEGILEQKDQRDQKNPGFSMRSDDGISIPIDVSQNAGLNDKAKTLTSKKVKTAGRVEKIDGPALPAKFKLVAKQLEASPVR